MADARNRLFGTVLQASAVIFDHVNMLMLMFVSALRPTASQNYASNKVSAIQGQRASNVYVKGPKEFSFVLYELRMNASNTEQHLGFQTLQASFFSYNQAIKVKRTEAPQENLFSIVTLCYFISLSFCCILINVFFSLSAVLNSKVTFIPGSSNENFNLAPLKRAKGAKA